MSFRWVKTPERLGEAIEKYGERMLVAVHAVASYWGQDIQDQARQSRTWTDRTGAARSGIFYAVEGFGLGPMIGELGTQGSPKSLMSDTTVESAGKDKLIIALGHTVFYGKYLELSNGGRHAIILSTIESNIPKLERLMQKQVSLLLG